jgi:glycerol uptake facilitator-like aquaporin
VTTVLGAGFMVSALQAEAALGLFMIAAAVGSVLFIVISTLAPISGAHFNPIVTAAFWFRKELSSNQALAYIFAQLLGAVIGALLANSMFNQATALSGVDRFNLGAMVGESIASAGLVFLILQLIETKKENLIAPAVALWIFAGHVFTSSTAFANPAVTFGRIFSSAPSSISIESAGYFLLAQLLGLALALFLFTQLRKATK